MVNQHCGCLVYHNVSLSECKVTSSSICSLSVVWRLEANFVIAGLPGASSCINCLTMTCHAHMDCNLQVLALALHTLSESFMQMNHTRRLTCEVMLTCEVRTAYCIQDELHTLLISLPSERTALLQHMEHNTRALFFCST